VHLPACDEDLPIVLVQAGSGSRLTLDGLSLAGSIEVIGGASDDHHAHLEIKHCALIPNTHARAWRAPASLVLHGAGLAVDIVRSVLGPIQVAGRSKAGVNVDLRLCESIVDGGHASALAISDLRHGVAPVHLHVERSTVIGLAQVLSIAKANGSSFLGPLLVAQRETGNVEACYVAPGSRTAQLVRSVHERPRYVSLQYGMPGYGQILRAAPEAGSSAGVLDCRQRVAQIIAQVANVFHAHRQANQAVADTQ
jgi:hypothetical protein